MASRKKDYYEILGVERNCTIEEIKKSYRKLAREYHPDVNNGDSEKAEKFKEISEAYAVLSNEEKRRQYDNYGFSSSLFDNFDSESVFSEFGFGDIFNMFFGGFGGNSYSSRTSTRRRAKGSNVESRVEITLKEAAFGVEKEVNYIANVLCEECNGTGSSAAGGLEKCHVCNGTGQVRNTRQTFIGSIVTSSVCGNCNGTGQLIKEPCKKCNGKGYYKQRKTIKVKIPPGINDGDSIRIGEEGNSLGKDSMNGDLFVAVSILPEKNFKRSGNDIISNIDITFTQAILGTKIEFETLDGTEEIVIEPGTQPNTRIILKSRGMVEFNGYRRGDLILNVNVKIPTKLTKDELESLKSIAINHGEVVGDGSKSFFASFKDAFRK